MPGATYEPLQSRAHRSRKTSSGMVFRTRLPSMWDWEQLLRLAAGLTGHLRANLPRVLRLRPRTAETMIFAKRSRVQCMVRDISKLNTVEAARRQHPAVVLTVGHSTRAQDDFIALLQAHGVKQLADVRTIPQSRHNPQFNRDRIASALQKARIRYVHMKALGGLRHPL